MAFFDLSLNELKTYCPERDEPADFDAFWQTTLEEALTFPLNVTFEGLDYGLVAQEPFEVMFNGFGGGELPDGRKVEFPERHLVLRINPCYG